MPVLRLNNLAVDFLDTGPPEAAAGDTAPVVLLHSAGMGAGQWRGLIELLRRDHRLIAPNLRGYGRSEPWPKDRAADLGAEVALVRALIDDIAETGGGPVQLVGHSLGAHIALLAARAMPERFLSLFLIEPIALGVLRDATRGAALAEVGKMVKACIAAFEAGDVNAAMTHFVDYWEGPGAWEAIPKAQRLFIYARADKMHQELRAVWADERPLAAYREIPLETHVVIGRETTRAAREMAVEIHTALPRSRYTELPGAGHMLPVSHPEVLAPLLDAHLRTHGKV